MANDSILVTGASGFVGGHLVRLLSAQGLPVRALYRNTPPSRALTGLPGVEWVACDLLDVYAVEDAMRGCSAVIHAAATVSFQPGDADLLLRNNRDITTAVVNEALEQGVRRFVHISSIAALGRTKDKPAVTEAESWEDTRGNSVYARSKRAAELEVWRGAGEGLSVAVLNPGIILGEPFSEEGWKSGSAALMGVADREFPYYTSGITAWVDVQDVARAALLLLQSEVQDERYILSAGNYGYREVFTQMAETLGKRPPHRAATPFMSGLIWRLNAVRRFFGAKPTVTRETAHTAQQVTRYDNAKFLAVFPEFSYTPLPRTIARMAAAYRAYVI